MLLAFSSLTALSFLLLFFAIRGRRIDDHPLCRNCRFDLTGLPPTSDNCPECGRNIRSPHTTTIGHRQRSTPLLALSAVLMLPAIFLGAAFFTHTSFIQYEPLWLLRFHLKEPATLRELTRRVDAGSVTEPSLAPILDDLLAIQSNPAAAWNDAYGEFSLDAATHSLCSPARWQSFLTHGIAFAIHVAPRIHPGADPEVWFTTRTTRLAFSISPRIAADLTLHLDASKSTFPRFTLLTGGSAALHVLPDAATRSLPLGPHAPTIDYTLIATLSLLPPTTIHGSVPLTFECVPAAIRLVLPNHDRTNLAAFQKAISVSNSNIRLPAAGAPLKLNIVTTTPPIPATFSVNLVQDNQTWSFNDTLSTYPPLHITHPPNELLTPIAIDPIRLSPPPQPGPAEILLLPINLDPDQVPLDPSTLLPIPATFAEPLHLPITLVAP